MRGRSFRAPVLALAFVLGFAACSEVPPRTDIFSVISRTPSVAAAPSLLLEPPPPPAFEAPPPLPVREVQRRAVLVGVNEAPGATELKGAVADAQTTRRALLRFGWSEEEIVVLTDRAAGRSAILSALAGLESVSSEGSAVFMFAGHTRKVRGTNHLVAGDGRMLSVGALASAMGAITAPMWASFPTCYAAGFAVPGIVGPGRVVTFASTAQEPSYEASWLGRSFLVDYMVHQGMLGPDPAPSVEEAFRRADAAMAAEHPDFRPLMDDRYDGEMRLGAASGEPAYVDSPPPDAGGRQPAPTPRPPAGGGGGTQPPNPDPQPQPTPTPTPLNKVRVCGPYVSAGDCNR